jgi:predicted nucleic acid-binding protein
VVRSKRALVTSTRAREEANGVAQGLGAKASLAADVLSDLFQFIIVVEEQDYAVHLEPAAEVLRTAVASRNGSVKDAHILALAWAVDGDIWSHDRDFAGTGWPSWSSANLRACLDGEDGAA